LATAAVAVFSLGLGVTAAEALDVYVGYADNLRASGFFPTPWIGDSGISSESSGAQSFDAGALLFKNTGASSVTITNLTVTLGTGPTTFSFWNPLAIGVGGGGVFTQTFSYNFDTSDYGYGSPPGGILPLDPGGNGIGGCSSTPSAQATAGITSLCASTKPVVKFSTDGGATFTTLYDSGHILDTGLYDFVNYSPDGNESIKWNLIGSAPDRGGTGAVPEASTWVMMLAGFAGLGFMGIRKSRKSTVAA
jgi:hypothetical protein